MLVILVYESELLYLYFLPILVIRKRKFLASTYEVINRLQNRELPCLQDLDHRLFFLVLFNLMFCSIFLVSSTHGLLRGEGGGGGGWILCSDPADPVGNSPGERLQPHLISLGRKLR